MEERRLGRRVRLQTINKQKRIKRYALFGAGAVIAAAALITALSIPGLFSKKKQPEPEAPQYFQAAAEEIDSARSSMHMYNDVATVVDAGLTLVGRVNYFWGGKSSAVGWDSEWGNPKEVTSTGSKSTGQTKPYGLDCSGFVSWCFIQSGMSAADVDEKIGNGTWAQWEKSAAISWEELKPGDFVFQNEYPGASENHIGICIGYTVDKEPLFVHCAASFDNVVVTNAGDVFRFARRPSVFE